MMTKDTTPELLIEKTHLGEGKPPQNGADKMALLKTSDEWILAEYPADLMATQIQRKVQKRKFRFSFDISPIALPQRLALASLVLILPVALFLLDREPLAPTERIKGLEPFISVYKKAGKGFEKLSSSVKVKEGDVLQLSYVAHDAKFGAIFSIDGNGKMTLHYPEKPGQAAKLLETGEVILGNAFELDNSPHFERFLFVTSSQPFDTQTVFHNFAWPQLAENNFELKLPNGLKSFSILLKK